MDSVVEDVDQSSNRVWVDLLRFFDREDAATISNVDPMDCTQVVLSPHSDETSLHGPRLPQSFPLDISASAHQNPYFTTTHATMDASDPQAIFLPRQEMHIQSSRYAKPASAVVEPMMLPTPLYDEQPWRLSPTSSSWLTQEAACHRPTEGPSTSTEFFRYCDEGCELSDYNKMCYLACTSTTMTETKSRYVPVSPSQPEDILPGSDDNSDTIPNLFAGHLQPVGGSDCLFTTQWTWTSCDYVDDIKAVDIACLEPIPLADISIKTESLYSPAPTTTERMPAIMIKPLTAYNYFYRDERDNIVNGMKHKGDPLPPPLDDFGAEKMETLLYQHWYVTLQHCDAIRSLEDCSYPRCRSGLQVPGPMQDEANAQKGTRQD
jgi:hypothetical protein